MGGLERLVLGGLLVVVGVEAVASGVAADRQLRLAFPEPRLGLLVGGVVGALVDRQLNPSPLGRRGAFDVGPQPAGADRLVLSWVADLDQPGS